MSIKGKILGWLVPSVWVDWLNGRKRILGAIALILWVAIYAVPALCVTPTCSTIAMIGATVRDFLAAQGIVLDGPLLTAGGTLTIIGVIDWIVDHIPSRLTSGILKRVEGKIAALLD